MDFVKITTLLEIRKLSRVIGWECGVVGGSGDRVVEALWCFLVIGWECGVVGGSGDRVGVWSRGG